MSGKRLLISSQEFFQESFSNELNCCYLFVFVYNYKRKKITDGGLEHAQKVCC